MINIEEVLYTRLLLKSGTIAEKTKIGEHAYHLKVVGDFWFRKMSPGQHIRVLIYPRQSGKLKDRLRTYSVWNYEEADGQGICHFAICSHADGPGSKWIQEVEVGQEMLLSAPFGKFTLEQDRPRHLFIGDVSTLGHFYFFRRQLSAEKNISSIIYSDQKQYFFPDIDGSKPFEFNFVDQDPELTIINLLKDTNLDDTIIYIGGDGRLCVKLSNYLLRERKLPKSQIKIKPFWMPGKTGLE